MKTYKKKKKEYLIEFFFKKKEIIKIYAKSCYNLCGKILKFVLEFLKF